MSESETFAKIKLDTEKLDRIVKRLDSNVKDILSSIAFDIEGDAKQMAPRKLGALINSIHTNIKGGGGSKPGNTSMRPNAVVTPLPTPTGKIIAIVGSGIDYAIYQELGTHKMSAQPFLLPAGEKNLSKIQEGETWRKVFKSNPFLVTGSCMVLANTRPSLALAVVSKYASPCSSLSG